MRSPSPYASTVLIRTRTETPVTGPRAGSRKTTDPLVKRGVTAPWPDPVRHYSTRPSVTSGGQLPLRNRPAE